MIHKHSVNRHREREKQIKEKNINIKNYMIWQKEIKKEKNYVNI